MRILSIHAHFDDFELTAAGTFELWKRRLGTGLQAKVIVCTDGKAGHHLYPRGKTGTIRLAEQQAAARIGGWEFQQLLLPGGQPPREACLLLSIELMAAVWKAIRDFEPDYLFCPPIPADPLAAIHNDHATVADVVRRVAYMINVPHAFSPEYPAEPGPPKPCKMPVILNVYDGYMAGANEVDLAIDVEPAFDLISEMSWSHQSQICEWLPWVGRHDMDVPRSLDDWKMTLRRHFEKHKQELGIGHPGAVEVFTVTAWGQMPSTEQLLSDFPSVIFDDRRREKLKDRLGRWRK